MERGSAKHGPRLDDEMEHEVRGQLQGRGVGGRAEEWREPEPAGEDQPGASRVPGGNPAGGVPPGMTADEVEQRSRLGRYLPLSALPGDKRALVTAARRAQAPTAVLDELAGLPEDGTEYETVSQVWQALGHHNEERRT
jgi:hypothetical protein